jgi:hypothetical protein
MTNLISSQQTKQIVAKIEPNFKKFPHLPKKIFNVLVQIAPWLALIGGILGVLGGLSSVLGANMVFWAARAAGYNPLYFQLMAVLGIVSSVLAILAFNPLKNRLMMGWYYLFWMAGITIVSDVIGVIAYPSTLIGSLIGLVIQFYILFELKPAYK